MQIEPQRQAYPAGGRGALRVTDINSEFLAVYNEACMREGREPRFGFSDSDGCLRAQYMDHIHYAEHGSLPRVRIPARWGWAAAKGHTIGAWLEAAARKRGHQTQVPVTLPNDYGLQIVGTADWVGPDFVADFKRCDDYAFKVAQKECKPGHWNQCHAYAYALDKPNAWIIYMKDVTKGEELPYVIHGGARDDMAAMGVIDHWRQLREALDAKQKPPRPYVTPDPIICRTCAWREPCWENP